MIIYLSVEQVIETHEIMLNRYGGLAGIRDKNLLCSAVDAPKAYMFGEEMYPSVYQKAATYFYHLICNHPFNDANKRTGYASALLFLKENNVLKIFKNEHLSNLAVEVAKGKETKERITRFLQTGFLD